MSTKYIIIAGGDGTRWDNYTGKPKHFAVIGNEPILYRTINLLRANHVAYGDIYVASKDYKVEYVHNYHIEPNYADHADADKFLSSSDLWNEEGRTVILYGDVYFSEDAIKQIIDYPKTHWTMFCRPTASKITGTPWGECFAVSFYDFDNKMAFDKLWQLIHLYKGKALDRIGGWEWARIVAEVPINKMADHQEDLPLYYVIDDITDDIDYPDDYDRLKKLIEGK